MYPVNPKCQTVQGLRCYSSLRDVPEAPDVVLVLVPAEHVNSVLHEAAEIGARAAIVFSAGFREAGDRGKELQDTLSRLATDTGLLVCGPNCLGVINVKEQIPLTFSPAIEGAPLKPGPVALVSQSGALGGYTFAAAQARGIGFSYWVTTGNEACLGVWEVVSYLLKDSETRVILVCLEDARSGDEMWQAGLLGAELGKPVVVLKLGRSEAGRRAAVAHTAALAGSERVYSGAFRQLGMVEVSSIQELLDCAVVFASGRIPSGTRVGIVTHSGGAGILMADECEQRGLNVPPLSDSAREALARVVPRFGSLLNPVDVTAEVIGRPELMKEALTAVLSDPAVDTLLVYIGGQKANAMRLAADLADLSRSSNKPMVVCWMAGPPEALEALQNQGIAVFDDPSRAASSVAHAARWYQRASLRSHRERARKLPDPQILSIDASGTSLSEGQCRDVLALYDLPLVPGRLVQTAAEAVEAAKEIGWPVVVKVDSPDVPHRSQVGAVRTDRRSEAEVLAACRQVIDSLRKARPLATVRGLLVEKMIEDALELFLGFRMDPVLGPTIALGPGGTLVEALNRVSVRLLPVTEEDVREMIEEAGLEPLLATHSEQGRYGYEALVRTVIRFSEVASSLRGVIQELEVNPLLVMRRGSGVAFADILGVTACSPRCAV